MACCYDVGIALLFSRIQNLCKYGVVSVYVAGCVHRLDEQFNGVSCQLMNLDGLPNGWGWGQIIYKSNSEEPLQITGILYRPDNYYLLEVEDQAGCTRYVHLTQVQDSKPLGMDIVGEGAD